MSNTIVVKVKNNHFRINNFNSLEETTIYTVEQNLNKLYHK